MQVAMQETKSSKQGVIKEACQSDETQINATQLLMHQRVIDLMQAPAADICTFDGDPLKYYTFIRAFDNSVHETTLSDSAKLTRLLKYVTGRPKAMVQGFLTMNPSAGYNKARQLLEQRFCDHFTIMKAWLDKITASRKGARPNVAQSLQEYADELRSCYETVNAMGPELKVEMNSQSTMLKLIERLPRFLQNRWKHHVWELKRRKERRPNYGDLMEFVEGAAEEENDPRLGAPSVTKERKRMATKLERLKPL